MFKRYFEMIGDWATKKVKNCIHAIDIEYIVIRFFHWY